MPSRTASTSTSMASSRKRSTRTGRSAVTPALAGQRARRHGLHDPPHALVVVDDLHGPAAQHVARAHQHRVADLGGDGQRLGQCWWPSPRRLRDAQLLAQGVPALTVLGQVDGGRARARARASGGREPASLSGVWPPERHDDPGHLAPGRLLGVEHVGHVLAGQRLEVEPVARCRSRSRPSRGCS